MKPWTSRFLLLLSCILFCTACDDVNLSFVNEIRAFEPKWRTLGDQISFIDRNLIAAKTRYQKDLNDLEKRNASRSGSYNDLKRQYNDMIKERENLEVRFNVQKEQFTGAAYGFNDWDNKVMQGKISAEEAREEFEMYKAIYNESNGEIGELQKLTLKNIDKHNQLMREMASMLNVFANYNLEPL